MSSELSESERLTKVEFEQEAQGKTLSHISRAVDTLVDKVSNVKSPTSFKDIIITIGSTMALMGMLATVVYAIVDFKTAVPIEQGKATSKKVEELTTTQNKLINLISLMSAEVKALDQKVESNTGFVEEYMYKEKVPSVITAIEKDIEYLKERRRHGK